MQRVSIRSIGVLAVTIWVLCAVSATQADPVSLVATQDPTVNSTFTLDFGVYGGQRQANITTTTYALETDAAGGTARFTSYFQTVDPIELPGGISTGEITVTIQESLPGPYDSATGLFATHDVYLIYFAGDLTPFGLTSPVALPGSAGGTITYTSANGGNIASSWEGSGQLQNPSDPQNPISFTYNCNTSTTFTIVPEPATLALLGLAALGARRRRG